MALEFVSGFVVSSILQEVVDRMKSIAADTINLAYNSDIQAQLNTLEATYATAQRVLGALDGWDLITSNLHRNWLGSIRRACYDAQDYTEYLNIEILTKIGDAKFLTTFFTKVVASHKLRNLQSNLHGLINDFETHHMARSPQRWQHSLKINTQVEPVAVPDDDSFSRKKDKNDIVTFFLQTITGSSSSLSLVTVSITGMFGIGKTTLAQVVMNDPQILHHFGTRIWVPVLTDFDLGETLKSIITDLQEQGTKMNGFWLHPQLPAKLSVIIRMFQDACKGKRILVVLDNLCNFAKPQQDWKDFEQVLCSCSYAMFGVIITARNPKVATTVASLSSFPTLNHFVQQMSDEDCASLVLRKAAVSNLTKRNRCGKTTLETNALEIAQRLCKGLPLVADIIGHRLSSTLDVATWSNMPSEDLWDMPEFRQQIFPAFRLNYCHLSIFLRSCLPYFSLFPENYNFNKEELMQLWLAEGLTKPQAVGVQYLECPGLEETGSYAFDEVLSRSILQTYPPFDQDPQIYRMHEFIRHYAQYVASDMYVRVDEQLVDREAKIRKARHISLVRSRIPPELWKDIEKCEGLRTIISLHMSTTVGQLSRTLFLKLNWLRVLVLRRSDVNELPESLGELKHLALLDLSETKIKALPRSTVFLYALQVLKLNLCSQLLQLPKDISNLTRLLHLEVDMKRLTLMPPNMGKLNKLRTLHAFKVGRRHGHRLSELKNMKYLKGSICLTNLENVSDEAEAREAKLSDKPFLKRVELEWKRNSTNQALGESILAALEPHENLQELQLNGYGGATFPTWLISPECKLANIHILRCRQCSIFPALGQLQHLKVLQIEEMDMVKYIDHHFLGSGRGSGFRSLESLKLRYMKNLAKWKELQVNQMRRLRELFIGDCPMLTSLPPMDLLISLKHLEITNCPVLEALPAGGLPRSLETLVIIQCDLLKQRCLPEHGADWNKINTISDIFIDFERI